MAKVMKYAHEQRTNCRWWARGGGERGTFRCRCGQKENWNWKLEKRFTVGTVWLRSWTVLRLHRCPRRNKLSKKLFFMTVHTHSEPHSHRHSHSHARTHTLRVWILFRFVSSSWRANVLDNSFSPFLWGGRGNGTYDCSNDGFTVCMQLWLERKPFEIDWSKRKQQRSGRNNLHWLIDKYESSVEDIQILRVPCPRGSPLVSTHFISYDLVDSTLWYYSVVATIIIGHF